MQNEKIQEKENKTDQGEVGTQGDDYLDLMALLQVKFYNLFCCKIFLLDLELG